MRSIVEATGRNRIHTFRFLSEFGKKKPGDFSLCWEAGRKEKKPGRVGRSAHSFVLSRKQRGREGVLPVGDFTVYEKNLLLFTFC